jgi:serine O-acetyltransferase
VLNHDSFESALCHRLAQRLSNADLGTGLVLQAFEDALEAEPEIARAPEPISLPSSTATRRATASSSRCSISRAFRRSRPTAWPTGCGIWGARDFAYHLQSICSVTFGVDIHPAARIGRAIMIDHAHSIVIGETAVVEDEVSMLHSVTLGGTGKEHGDRHPKVRRGVLIGAGAKILGNIEIGQCSRIASGSVVLHDVPANRTVAGVPAKVVGYAGCSEPARSMDHIIAETGEA